MFVTLAEIAMLVSPLHAQNAADSMADTLSGTVMLVKPLQSAKVLFLMVVILLGRIIDVNL